MFFESIISHLRTSTSLTRSAAASNWSSFECVERGEESTEAPSINNAETKINILLVSRLTTSQLAVCSYWIHIDAVLCQLVQLMCGLSSNRYTIEFDMGRSHVRLYFLNFSHYLQTCWLIHNTATAESLKLQQFSTSWWKFSLKMSFFLFQLRNRTENTATELIARERRMKMKFVYIDRGK